MYTYETYIYIYIYSSQKRAPAPRKPGERRRVTRKHGVMMKNSHVALNKKLI